jgi:serine/threonine protein kinase
VKKVCVKDVDDNDIEMSEVLDKVVNIARQALVLAKYNHPNIIYFYESFTEANSFYIVTEYCQGGDLAKRIKFDKQRKIIPREAHIVKWAIQLTSALNYMHNNKDVLHRNIYPM